MDTNPQMNSVAVLREVYCRMAGKCIEGELRAEAPIPKHGHYFSHWFGRFCVEIIFGVPGLGDYEYSARLIVYIPTPTPGQWPGDVFAIYTAMADGDTETQSPTIHIQLASEVQGADEYHHRACAVIREAVFDHGREARLRLFRMATAVA